jgi:flagellar assembly factor FliW
MDYVPEAVFHFQAGIPGFEDQTAFVFLEQPHTDPLVFMQSLEDPGLCFIAVAPSVACPGYRVGLLPEEREFLGLPRAGDLEPGKDILCLALVTVSEHVEPTVNLASPIVLNMHNYRGIQSIPEGSTYSFRHPLPTQEELATCS